MGRIRTIKPEFSQSETMGKVSRDARLTFILLWTFADDSGRTRGNSRMLASSLFPYDDDAAENIESWLKELEKASAIFRYKVNGDTFLQINNWTKHQKIDKPTPSKIPPFDDGSRSAPGGFSEDSPNASRGLGMGMERKGKEGKGSSTTPTPPGSVEYSESFLRFWGAYPRKDAKADAFATFQKVGGATNLPAILAALAWQTKTNDWTKDGGQFVPLAATYLNKKRWLDEAPAQKAKEVAL